MLLYTSGQQYIDLTDGLQFNLTPNQSSDTRVLTMAGDWIMPNEAYLPKPPQDILDALLQEGQGDDKGGVIHIDSDGTITRQQLSNLQPDILSVFSGNATSPYMRAPSRISFTCSTSSNTVIDNVLECTFSVPDVSFPSGPMLLYFHDYVVADSEWHNIIATCDFGFTDMIINNYTLGDPSNTEGLITNDYEAQIQFLYAGVQEMTSPTNWSIRIPTNISPSSKFTRVKHTMTFICIPLLYDPT